MYHKHAQHRVFAILARVQQQPLIAARSFSINLQLPSSAQKAPRKVGISTANPTSYSVFCRRASNMAVDFPNAEYRQLGRSGLRVSVPILGAMSFGDKRWQP